MSEKNNDSRMTTRDLAVRGTIMAAIITIPSLAAFFISWTILEDLVQAAIVGAVVHFIAMGFSLKISRTLVKKTGSKPDA